VEGEKQDLVEGSRTLEWENNDQTLWRGRPPPKWKKKLHMEQEPVM
jgi:hypothetical protein